MPENLEFGVIKTNITDYATYVRLDITYSQSTRFQQSRVTRSFLRNGYHKEKYLNYLRHCLELLNFEQDVDRLTESLADALTTAVHVFTFKEKVKPVESNKSWFDKNVKQSIIRRNFAFNRYKRYRTPFNKTKYTKMRNRVCELLRSKKREYFENRQTRFLYSPKRFFNELNRLIGREKKNVNFIIADDESKLHTDDFAESNLFNQRFVSMSKTLAASIPTVPFTTECLANNEKSLFFYPTDILKVSKIVRNLKNHKSPD